MNNLLIHPTTNHQMETLIQAEPHSILIYGSEGSGKQAIAQVIALNVLDIQSVANPRILYIKRDDTSIGIDQVRTIREFLKRKTTGEKSIRRMIVIIDSHLMTDEAQNAILKTLEEPPKDTMILLTADDPTKLKHTIRSRTQQLIVLPVSKADAKTYFTNKKYKQQDIDSAFYMSDGRAGLMSSILNESDTHKLVIAIANAKQLLNQSKYERLLKIDTMIKDKINLKRDLVGLETIVSSGIRLAADKNNVELVRKFYSISKSIEKTKQELHENGNPKLLLTKLFLNI